MSTEPKKASDEQIALLRRIARDYLSAEHEEAALTAVLDQLECQSAELEQCREQLSQTYKALQWMAQNGAHIAWSNDSETCNVWLPGERDGTEARPAEGYPQKSYDSWERAITAVCGWEIHQPDQAQELGMYEATEKVCKWRFTHDGRDGQSLYIAGCSTINGVLDWRGDFCCQCGGRIVEVTE